MRLHSRHATSLGESGPPLFTCPGHCASACPAGAFDGGRLNIRRCAAFHVQSRDCHGRCHARLACPEGVAHRHGTLQHHYHNERVDGRRMLAAALGITDDTRAGEGPHWAAWAEEG